MRKAKLIGVLVAVILSIIVMLQNRQPVETRILFITITMPNAVMIGLTLLIGMAAGMVIALTMTSKREPSKKSAAHPSPTSTRPHSID